MAAVNANIVVEQTNLAVNPTTNSIGVTVEPTNVGIFAGGISNVVPGGTPGQLQYNFNNTTFAGVANTSVASNGTVTFSNLANLRVDGGVNGYVLQTDGTGTLGWTAQSGGGGTGNPGGANTQIQYNDSGSFGGYAGFTFDETTGNVAMPTNLTVATNVQSGSFTGNGAGLLGVLTAGSVTSAAQPNITSTGTLTSLTVTNNITSASGIFNGDGGGLSNIAAANVTGLSLSQIANGTSNVDIATANGNVDFTVGSANVARMSTTGAAYPGVLAVNGNITAKNDITAEPGAKFIGDGSQLSGIVALTANTVTNNAQPNITTVGTLTSLSLSSNNVTLGNNSITGANAIALGYNAFGAYSAVSIGYGAGAYSANTSILANYSVAIGHLAGYGNTRGNASIAIGMGAGVNQGANSIAIGRNSGVGSITAGANAVAIGHLAGVQSLHNNSIVINATGANLDSGGPNTLYIKPISGTSALTTSPLVYNSTTGLVTKEDELRVTNISSDNFIVPTSNGSASLGYTGQRFSDLFVNNVVITNTIKANITPTTAVSTTISHKIPIEINGTTYYICLDSNP
jgi:hypothetical protein